MNKDKMLTLMIKTFLLICLISGGLLLLYIVPLKISDNKFNELEKTFNNELRDQVKTENERVNIALKKIQKKNEDTVAWISIPETKVNYPVMHTPKDPEYYLHKSFEKQYSLSGVPFINHKVSMNPRSDNILIHGHHMKDDSMFSELLLYEDKDFLKKHPQIEFYTLEGKEIYDILAVIPTEVYSNKGDEFNYHNFITAKSKDDFDKYVKLAKELSLYDTGVKTEYGDHLLTLSTCAYHIDNGRFVVIGSKKQKI